jgi:hypothetical protein
VLTNASNHVVMASVMRDMAREETAKGKMCYESKSPHEMRNYEWLEIMNKTFLHLTMDSISQEIHTTFHH